MDPFLESTDPSVESTAFAVEKPYRMHARVAWILMAVVAVIALIPFLGFASWFIAGPMLLVSFIMIVMVFAKGGVAHGLALLACQIIVMPVVVLFGPFISSALGFVGTAAGVGAAIESSSTSAVVPSNRDEAYTPSQESSTEIPVSTDAAPSPSIPLSGDLRELKAKLLDQRHAVTSWLGSGKASETPSGFLKSGNSLDVESRKMLQQQNLWREQAFARIADLTGKSPEEVAKAFARLAADP